MGRSKRHFKGNNKSNDKKRRRENEEEWQQKRQDNRDEFVTKPGNEKFEAFYQAQLNLDDQDWDAFMDALKRPLPACFRINTQYPFADELKKQLQQYAGASQTVDGVEIAPVKQLAWYPNGDGYKLGTDRRTLRKSEQLEKLHKWMVQHTENGNITRQEAVSMVPPLALNVSPNHKCLDMCAAPGSKTTQILEIVMGSLGTSDQGIVIANDADTDRAYMLVHQCRRLNSPLLMVTTHKGQEFPTVISDFNQASPSVPVRASRANGVFDRVLCDVPCSGDGTLRKTPNIWAKWGISSASSLYPLQLQIAERGLRLVKCGGILVYSTCSLSPYEDEAVVAQLLRANKDTLELIDAREFIPHFNCRPGLTDWLVLDDSQVKRREKPVNKKDNETVAVAEENGEESNGANKADGMEVAEGEQEGDSPVTDATDQLKGLEKCLAMGMTQFHSYSEIPENLRKKYKEFIFPPTAEEISWMHLERCLRCLPQDEDTGGFFVCAMRRLSPPQSAEESTEQLSDPAASVETEAHEGEAEDEVKREGEGEEIEEKATNDDSSSTPPCPAPLAPPPVPRPRGYGAGRTTVDLKLWDQDSFQRIKEYFGLIDMTGEEFYIREDYTDTKQRKEFDTGVKDSSSSKSIYLLPAVTRGIMSGDIYKRLKIVSAGIKVFERCAKGTFAGGGDCGYRLLQEGVDVIAPYVTKRKVEVTIQDMCNFIEGGLVSFSTLSRETVTKLQHIQTGSILAYYDFRPEDVLPPAEAAAAEGEEATSTTAAASTATAKTHRLHVVCWRGANPTLNIMCSKLDSESMKHQLQAMNVLRPKISAKKPTSAEADTSSEAVEAIGTAKEEPVGDMEITAAEA